MEEMIVLFTAYKYIAVVVLILSLLPVLHSTSPVSSDIVRRNPSVKSLKSNILHMGSLFNGRKERGKANNNEAELKQFIVKPGDGTRGSKVSFLMTPEKHKTYHRKIYDRTGDAAFKGFRRTEALLELNNYKEFEMIVAPESKGNTRFHVAPKSKRNTLMYQ